MTFHLPVSLRKYGEWGVCQSNVADHRNGRRNPDAVDASPPRDRCRLIQVATMRCITAKTSATSKPAYFPSFATEAEIHESDSYDGAGHPGRGVDPGGLRLIALGSAVPAIAAGSTTPTIPSAIPSTGLPSTPGASDAAGSGAPAPSDAAGTDGAGSATPGVVQRDLPPIVDGAWTNGTLHIDVTGGRTGILRPSGRGHRSRRSVDPHLRRRVGRTHRSGDDLGHGTSRVYPRDARSARRRNVGRGLPAQGHAQRGHGDRR